MILFATSHPQAAECLARLREVTDQEVTLAESLNRAVTLLRSEDYVVVVLDQYLIETQPDEIDSVLQHLGTAIPVHVNLAISGVERLAREVRFAVHRRRREELAARRAAISTLHSELNETVTALLLSCELVLEAPDLPSRVTEKLRSAHALVKKLRSQLDSGTVRRD